MYEPGKPLKREAKYGVYPWWPEEGTQWIHPHDVPKAKELIPSDRVLRCSELDRDYSTLVYGELSVRVKATMWLPVRHEGFDVGAMVEICSRLGKNEPFVATIREMIWNDQEKRVEYEVSRNERHIDKRFLAADLQHVEELEKDVRPVSRLNPGKPSGGILRASAMAQWQD